MSLVGLGLSAHLGQRRGASQASLWRRLAAIVLICRRSRRQPNIRKGTRRRAQEGKSQGRTGQGRATAEKFTLAFGMRLI